MKTPPRLSNIKPRIATADLTRAKVPAKVVDPFYASPEWKALRMACLERDHFRCVSCGDRATVADHKISRRRWFAERLPGSPDTLGNLRSFCGTCDRKVKEMSNGIRRNGGSTGVIGADGFPVPLPS